ncbi:type I secretion system permease/ATPase [Rickettsia sp. R2]|uniref:peptidase domain-containing ABC transporter n=1 Tax=spotted fever group TaxID=114277 RepID=UPI002B1CCE74|nr:MULTISPECIES: type I secretion system permease/ATPase [spotted fever group]
MTEEVRTAIGCSQLLLQLAGIKTTEDTAPLSNMSNNRLYNHASSSSIDSSLKELSKTYGVKLKQKKLTYKKLTVKSLPLAFLATDGEYRVLAKMDQDNGLVQHPFKSNAELWSKDQLRHSWSGKVIILSAPLLKFDLAWFIPAFWQHRRMLAEILLFSLILQLLALVLPLFFQVVMDKVLVYKTYTTLDVLVFGLLVTSIFEVILRGLREYQYIHTANRIDILLGVKLVKHLLGLPLLYFKNRQVGSLVARVRELDSIREFLSSSLFTLAVDISFMGIFLAVMWIISPLLTLVVLASLPFYAIIAWCVTKPLQARLETMFRYMAANTAFLTESIAGAETVKSLAVEPRLAQRWETQTRDLVNASYHNQILSSLSDHSVQGLGKLTGIVILWYGAESVINLDITLGQLIAFNMLSQHFLGPIAKLVELWRKFIQAQVAVDILGDILNLPTEQETAGKQQELTGEIILKKVAFRYQPTTPLVLQDISLHIRAGKQIGIVGESGSGKSTLAHLLLRLYLPEQGQILFDGESLNTLDIVNLRQQVAVVLQENLLFNRSVRDNIALSFPEASLESVVEVAKLAGAHEFILRLPMGYDTLLAEGGSSLSGGQRQRIAIARALLTKPRILILDEATSSLDYQSQAIIQANMAEIANNRTVITIAHRLSTVKHCDCIIVLQQGKIIEQGTHQLLLELGGKYAHLWQLQQDLQREAS